MTTNDDKAEKAKAVPRWPSCGKKMTAVAYDTEPERCVVFEHCGHQITGMTRTEWLSLPVGAEYD